MEFLGKTVQKELPGYGVCCGVVKSYDGSSGLFEIGFEGGISEKLGFAEVRGLLEGTGAEPVELKRRRGRPRKRRRVQPGKAEERGAGAESGNLNSNCCNEMIAETLGGEIRGDSGNCDLGSKMEVVRVDLNEDVEKAGGAEENMRETAFANGNLNVKAELDLNSGFNFNLNEGLDLNENANDQGGLKWRECIDLNLDVNGGGDGTLGEFGMDRNHVEGQTAKCSFDLNLGVDEELKDEVDGECRVQSSSEEMVKEKTEKMNSSGAFERLHNDLDIANEALQEVPVTSDSCLESAEEIWKKNVVIVQGLGALGSVDVQGVTVVKEDAPYVNDGNHDHRTSAFKEQSSGRRRGRRRLIDVQIMKTPETKPVTDAYVVHGIHNDASACKEVNGLRRGRSRGSHVNALNSTPDTTANENSHIVQVDFTREADGDQVDEGSAYKMSSGNNSKRRRLSAGVNGTQETTILRRSSRRNSIKTDSSTTTLLSAVNGSLNELSVSPSVSAVTEEKPLKSCRKRSVEPMILPAKMPLPISSQKFDLSGISIVDLFSVYSCLRSFSTILYLSPFEVEDFVAALKCTFPSSLFDCIHVSILQTLRKHLEFLSNEGVESASVCLRSLNWGFLDLVTWPVFMVEYLLIQGLDLKPGFNLTNLELFKNDYYKQPVSVKVEILRCLCDGIIEVEAIRSELTRRSSGAEYDMDLDRNMSSVSSRKMRNGRDIPGGSSLAEEVLEDTADGNIDECRLCKMDGSLICCDGCPGAYHSKCVGVVNDSLPEGDWFCPECLIDRNKPWMKYQSSIRGAELLGVDPYGRLYFGSYGYLLVSDSCESESSFNYYHRDDIIAVIRMLRSLPMVYGSLLEAIHKHWDIPVNLCDATGDIHHANIEVSNFVSQTCVSSEGSAETTQTSSICQNLLNEGSTVPSKSTDILNESDMRGNFPPLADKSLDLRTKNSLGTKDGTSQMQKGTGYMNYYSFGRVASLVAEELLRKPLDKSIDNSAKTEEEKISTQMKIMSKVCPKFHWPHSPIQSSGVQNEKCGWCFTCRGYSDDLSCLFNTSFEFVHEELENDLSSFQSKRSDKGHLADIISHILVVEKRLQGLLSGPWLNPHYSSLWRTSVHAATDIESVKHLLLTLVSNVRHLALSSDWWKHVDSCSTMGSASHIIMASSRASSKKRSRHSEFDSGPSSSVSGLALFWWRGGRISRQIFNWKVLPRSLISKAARQAGCIKIPGMLYPENSDIAKRSKCVAWRAAVESATSAEQLALQVREFDLNIRWDEIMKSNSLSMVDKEFKKSVRLFKKVVVRRKSVEKDGAKYLLDFGKRRSIPEIVLKNGSVVEESSSERKKYWLHESYVPLYMLKSFEEKRVARKSGKPSSGKISASGLTMKKPSRKRGFPYLFAKAERSQYHQCGHCNKDVPIRDAVCCQYCKGFFHKRHVSKSGGSVAAKCTYTCHKCVSGKSAKTVTKTAESTKTAKIIAETVRNKGRRGRPPNKIKLAQLKNSKKAPVRAAQITNSKRTLRSSRLQKNKKVTVVLPVRRSPRKVKNNLVQGKKVGRGRKAKKGKSKKSAYQKKQPKVISWRKKRSQAYHSYWLNGLLLSRKPNDARVKQFRRKRFLAPSESIIRDQPRCPLCSEAGYRSSSTYISCEICGEWYHGDAFGLGGENTNMLIGFRCHLCRKCTPPKCPFVSAPENPESENPEMETEKTNRTHMEPISDNPNESNSLQESPVNETRQSSLPVDDSAHTKEQLDPRLENKHVVQGCDGNLDQDNHTGLDHNVVAASNDKLQAPSIDVDMAEVGLSDCEIARDRSTVEEHANEVEATNAVQGCYGNLDPDNQTGSDHDAIAASNDKLQAPDVGADMAEVRPSDCENARDSSAVDESANEMKATYAVQGCDGILDPDSRPELDHDIVVASNDKLQAPTVDADMSEVGPSDGEVAKDFSGVDGNSTSVENMQGMA